MPTKIPPKPRRVRVNTSNLPIVLKALLERPSTLYELMDATDTGLDGMRSFLKAMHEHGLIYIADWKWEGHNSSAVYAFGPGEDVERQWSPTDRKLLALFAGDLLSRTAEEAAKVLGISRQTVTRSLARLHAKGFLIMNKREHCNIPASYRRNPCREFPAVGPHPLHFALKERPKVAPQSWFSAIA